MQLETLLQSFQAMSYWEYIAALLSAAYVLLAAKQSLWCWSAAFLSTFIYTLLFWQGALLMESALNFYYMAMAFYGWHCWQRTKNNIEDSDKPSSITIQSWHKLKHGLLILITSCMAGMTGYLLTKYTHAEWAYLDSLTSLFAVLATYLITQKVLENWLYWVAIDLASIYLFWQKGYYPTVVLFIFYTLMAIYGYLRWSKDFQLKKRVHCAEI